MSDAGATPVTYEQVICESQARFRDLKRLTQFYHRFAGEVVRIQQDRGSTLTDIHSSGGTVDLRFEQDDGDGFSISLRPWRNDLVFVSRVGFWARVRFDLFRFCADPEGLQRVNEMQMKTRLGGFFSVSHRTRSRPGAAVDLEPPGTMELLAAGSRVHVATSLIWNLETYRQGRGFDRTAIERDLDAVTYGLEKCLETVLRGRPPA